MSTSLFLFLLVSAVSGSTTTGAGAVAPFPPCLRTTCGLQKIIYPFWLYSGSYPSSYCGYQSFAIHCRNNSPFLYLPATDNHLAIARINYTNRTLSLYDPAAAANPCPHFITQPQLAFPNDSLFTVTPTNVVLTFFLNCSCPPLNSSSYAGGCPIPCLDNGSKRSYLYADENDSPGEKPCDSVVSVPARKEVVDYISTSTKSPDVGKVMSEGFELEWPKESSGVCGDCERSGGRCGYQEVKNVSSGGGVLFGCYCAGAGTGDGEWRSYVCGKKKKNKGAIIGVSIAAGILLISILSFFIFYKRRYRCQQKQQLSPSSILLFNPSSTTDLPFSGKDPELGNYAYTTHIFSYDELSEATNSFDSASEIGDGGYGTVYKGKLRDGRIVAVKRLYESNIKRAEQFANEIVILSRLRHQNLVSLYGCTSPGSLELLLVYELVPNGTVADHLHGPRAAEGHLTWALRLSVAVETAAALAYLHAVDPPIIHRDVKTGNILLDADFHVKVADFGLSRHSPTDGATHISTAPQGTPGYLDPEYHQSYKLTDRSDVYSFGVVLAELLSSKPAVDLGRDRAEINLSTMAVNRIQSGKLEDLVDRSLGFDVDPDTTRMISIVAELTFRCLQADREMRPPIQEVLQVLKGLQSGASSVLEKGGVAPPFSPDTVTEKWVSRSTTPGCSQ